MNTPELEKRFLAELHQHQPLINKVCRIYAHTAEDREDLFQEITIQLWRSYASFKKESKFSTWLYRVAINTAITRVRKKRLPTEPLEMSDHAFLAASDANDDIDRLSHLYRAIGQLNDVEKSIVMLYLDDHSYAEMEEILGIGQGALRVRMNRIKEKIRTLTQNINHGLDDFKTVWKDAAGPALYGTEELRKLMLQDGDNPIFLLKRKFRKGMRLMIILFVIITTQFLRGGHPFHHALFWFYSGFSVVMLSYFAFSYRLAGRMMSTYKPVKAQLESQFRLLEKIFLWRKLFTRLIPVIFIGMLEFMTYQTNDPGLKNWSLHPVSQRVAYYVVAYLIFYTITYLAFRFRYARHLEGLKSLIRELN